MLDCVKAFKSSSHGLVQVLLYISAPSCNNHIWKEMGFLTTHSTHFILRLYGVGNKSYFFLKNTNKIKKRGNTFNTF